MKKEQIIINDSDQSSLSGLKTVTMNSLLDTKEKYRFLKDAEAGKVKSYVQETALAVLEAMEEAVSREDFIDSMNRQGYQVNWLDNHKYITFTTPEGMKVRNKNLEKTYHLNVGKEDLKHVFEENARRKERSRADIQAARRGSKLRRSVSKS